MDGPLLLTGAGGFLGRNAREVLERHYDVRAVTRADYDLLDQQAVRRMYREVRPTVVVHLAGLVGGIAANKSRPADFCYENLLLDTLVVHEAALAGVKKFVACVGSCAYPAEEKNPLTESRLWSGYPATEAAPFSTAKRMLHVLAAAYRGQYGLKAAVAIPGNVYGRYDNFSLAGGHVVPALIHRFHEARQRGDRSVTCWGTGSPTRDFMYADDLAACLPYLIEEYDDSRPLNIARSETTSIRQLAETIAAVCGFAGEILWDTSKPDGQQDKILDCTRMLQLGLACPTSLEEGVRRTHAWFVEHLETEVRR